jgi:GDP-L-fucose synthase
MMSGQTNTYWADKRIWVTGGKGFLGRHVMEQLHAAGCAEVMAPRSSEYDLRDKSQIYQALRTLKPDVVIHLAAVVGGIGANRKYPGRFFYENAIMGIELIEACRVEGIQKAVILGTICAYPKFTPIPFKEENIWMGYPEETNAPYGLAKKMLLVQSQAYRDEYGFNSIYLLPVNLYGPWDNFDPESSHVIPALIRKVLEAKQSGADHFTCWGTGKATREFLFVEDCARAILMATEEYNDSAPVNLGSGMEISIRELAEIIAKQIGFQGDIRWDHTKPDGQPRRCLDTQRANERFHFEARVSFKEGLRRTIDWYTQHTGA